jgi:hypothetical protein
VYFLANCLTFVSRFLIFHYVLIADRDAKDAAIEAESLSPVAVAQGPEEDERA